MTANPSTQTSNIRERPSKRFPTIERLAEGWAVYKENLIGKIGLTLLVRGPGLLVAGASQLATRLGRTSGIMLLLAYAVYAIMRIRGI